VIWPLIGLLGFSIIYLGYSLVTDLGPLKYIVRHYALFIYLAFTHLIFSSFIDDKRNELNIRFIVLIGLISVPIQLITHAYNFITIENYPLFNRFNYFSLLGVIGIIVSGAWVLIYQRNIFMKILIFLAILFLSSTLGHASAFLACFVTGFVYLMLIGNWQIKFIGTILLAFSLWAFFVYFPQFSDHNSMWRLLYWKETMREGLSDYYGVFGHGFGVPFVSEDVIIKFKDQLNSGIFEYQPEEQFLSPMHNSFITIFFHLGILPGLLIFIPLWKPIIYFTKRNAQTKDHKLDFLLLSLVGSMIWASFNVVLELPHSSAFFWLIYFSLIYSLEGRYKSHKK